MSLRSPLGYTLPEETARFARAACRRGNPYLRLADALGPIFSNPQFADLYPQEGRPAEDPAQLALVTLFQFAENLTDRQAAEAVRTRIDWKYALCRPLMGDGEGVTPTSDEGIAQMTGIPVETVTIELDHLTRALGLDDMPRPERRAEVALLALRSGLVEADDGG